MSIYGNDVNPYLTIAQAFLRGSEISPPPPLVRPDAPPTSTPPPPLVYGPGGADRLPPTGGPIVVGRPQFGPPGSAGGSATGAPFGSTTTSFAPDNDPTKPPLTEMPTYTQDPRYNVRSQFRSFLSNPRWPTRNPTNPIDFTKMPWTR